jgi:alkyldihydroxyacetonephosphate synthase
MLRLSTPEETRTTLLLAGHEKLVRALETYLSFRGAREEKCLLLVGVSGSENLVRQTRRQALGTLAMLGGVAAGKAFGREWHRNRFRAPYLRNSLWEAGWAVDTLETAAPWSRVPALLASVESALRDGLAEEGERVHAFTHFSHVYLDGSSLYTTYLFRLDADPEVSLARWRTLKTAASAAIAAGGGTISHQHGVGTDHMPWITAEKGELGVGALRELFRFFDPAGLLNPGKLVP